MASIFSSPIEPFEPRGRQLMAVHPQDDGTDADNLASGILSAPKLTSKSSLSGASGSTNDEIWTIRQVSNGEEELYTKGKCVYWTRNSLIVKSFNFTEQVTKAFWSKFAKRDHVCVSLASGMSIFNKIGQHFQIPLPFAYHNMYSIELGLIIERNCDLLDDSTLPVLFALTHPNQDISPVIFKPFCRGSQQIQRLSYSIPSTMSIVACHSSLLLCLMYDSQDCQHSIWKIRPTTDEELDEYHKITDESTTFLNYQSSCSFREGLSHSSLNLSARQRSSIMHQSNQSPASTMNYSPKMDLRSKHSTLGTLAASRLGAGVGQSAPDNNATNIKSFNSASHTINTMSTPNRNRIINYLRDNIEEPIMPEITFEQIWTEPSNNSSKANKFFTTNDLEGNEFIVIVTSSSNQLKVIKYEKTKEFISFGRANFVPAIDAMHIAALSMMLVIGCNKSLSLYSGFDRLINVNVPKPPSFRLVPISSPASIRNSADISPIHMSSARKRSSLGDRSSTGSDASFQQIFQALSPVPHLNKNETKTSSPTGLSDIKQIEHIIGRTVYILCSNNQRARFEVPEICQTQYVRKLIDCMKLFVNRDQGLAIVTKWFQTRRASTESEFMTAGDELNLFKNWFIDCIGLGKDFFNDDSLMDKKSPNLSSKRFYVSPTKKLRRTKEQMNSSMVTNLPTLFYAMHLVFEDLLLLRLNYDIAYNLAELLLVLSCMLELDAYQEYYWMKFPELQAKLGHLKIHLGNIIPNVSHLIKPPSFRTIPPSVIGFLSKILTNNNKKCELLPFPVVEGVTKDTQIIISLFSEMFNIDRTHFIMNISSNLSNYPHQEEINCCPHRSELADRLVVELMVEFRKDRNYLSCLPEGINLYLWDSILNCRESPPSDWSEACFALIGRMDLVSLVRGQSQVTSIRSENSNDNEDATLKLIFPDDIRMTEAHAMLASNVPVEFSITQRPGAGEEESRDETHRHLYLLNVRTMAMPVGRGAVNLRTYSPVIGESFEVPRLDLSGRSPSEDRAIEYTHDISVYPWPFFHNGVAAGLTICSSATNNIIDSTWINYNRPRSNMAPGADMRDRDLTAANINNEHAGFLFALGLNGHLEKLSLMALHDYLCQNNDLTKLAILLGMSAAKRGSRDNNIIKVLSIHVDALLPPNSTELDVSAPVHSASIIGVGLLYQSSGDSHISKVLLEEIGRLPGPESNSHIDRESYSLSAGIAFGIVNLCKGGSTTISSSDQLRLYMLGGKRKVLTASQRERYFKQDCHRGEDEYINTHVTSPGGTLGLGLMYHRSNNESVANWMRAPDTQTLLEYVRPDFLILRMLCYGLIMWDKIEATEDYIDSHIPKIVSTHAFQRNIPPNPAKLVASVTPDSNIDYELISQTYCNIVAGCCMAIAMRNAGTGNQDAYNIIYKHTKMLISFSNKPSLVEQAGKPCIESCLNVLVTSLAVVMAGTGDIGVIRVCRYLRSRLTQSCVFYGNYMAVHTALGILFLGNCRYSLSTSPESIGALVCALYPIYPNHSSDNRYHLQALRHLYVLAAEPRLLIPRDILTNKPVYANITVRHRQESGAIKELQLRAPCLVPEVQSIENVCVDDDRYWRIEINNKETLIRCLFQDQGYLSVKRKAHSSNNQLVQNIETYILQNMPPGTIKSRKSSALAECVKEDRVEQYSALNNLLTKSQTLKHKSLILEQIRIAATLTKNQTLSDKAKSDEFNKIDLLKPVIGEFESEQTQRSGNLKQIEERWFEYISKKRNWIDTEPDVAHYMILYDLNCVVEDDLLQKLKQITV